MPGSSLKPLNPINQAPIDGDVPLAEPGFTTPGYQPPFEHRNPIGGSALYNLSQFENGTAGATVIIQARDLITSAWITVFQGALTTEQIYRLPTGIKSDGWQFTIIGNTPIYSFSIAETGKELMSI